MRTILYVVAGLAILFVIVFGGGITWLANRRVDVNDPDMAQRFRTKLATECHDRSWNFLNEHGKQPDYQQEALINEVCTCDANALIDILKRKKDMTAYEMEKAIEAGVPEMNNALRSCADAYGVTGSTGEFAPG